MRPPKSAYSALGLAERNQETPSSENPISLLSLWTAAPPCTLYPTPPTSIQTPRLSLSSPQPYFIVISRFLSNNHSLILGSTNLQNSPKKSSQQNSRWSSMPSRLTPPWPPPMSPSLTYLPFPPNLWRWLDLRNTGCAPMLAYSLASISTR